MADVVITKSNANTLLVEAHCVECDGIVFCKISKLDGYVHKCQKCGKIFILDEYYPYLIINKKYKIYIDELVK